MHAPGNGPSPSSKRWVSIRSTRSRRRIRFGYAVVNTAPLSRPSPQPLTLIALGYSGGTPKGGLTAQVVQFASLDALKAADPASIKGKIVYIGFRMHRYKDGHDYGIGAGIREAGPLIAAAKGAAAFLLRSAGTDANSRTPHTGVTGFTDFAHPEKALPAAALSNPDADQLERVLAYNKPVTLKLDLDCGFEGQYTGYNVIGEITGRKYPDQVVAIGGHLDSWDPGTGAIDDGAGVAIALGAAKLIHDLPQRPDRTVRVIAFANEEMGLWGGRAYAEKHAAEVAKFQLGSESDLGAAPVWKMTASVKPQARGAIEQIAKVLAPIGVAYDPKLPGGGGSDLSQIASEGHGRIVAGSGRDLLLRLAPHRQRHAGQDRPATALAERGGVCGIHLYGCAGRRRLWLGTRCIRRWTVQAIEQGRLIANQERRPMAAFLLPMAPGCVSCPQQARAASRQRRALAGFPSGAS